VSTRHAKVRAPQKTAKGCGQWKCRLLGAEDELVSVDVLEDCGGAPGFDFGGLHELDASRFELLVGLRDVVAGLRARNAELDPALLVIGLVWEGLVREDDESEFLDVEVEGGVLIMAEVCGEKTGTAMWFWMLW
jgi:hypothetical protein